MSVALPFKYLFSDKLHFVRWRLALVRRKGLQSFFTASTSHIHTLLHLSTRLVVDHDLTCLLHVAFGILHKWQSFQVHGHWVLWSRVEIQEQQECCETVQNQNFKIWTNVTVPYFWNSVTLGIKTFPEFQSFHLSIRNLNNKVIQSCIWILKLQVYRPIVYILNIPSSNFFKILNFNHDLLPVSNNGATIHIRFRTVPLNSNW